LVFTLYATIKMMHGPINIRFPYYSLFNVLILYNATLFLQMSSINVKFTIEQATNAPRGSRGIAPHFL